MASRQTFAYIQAPLDPSNESASPANQLAAAEAYCREHGFELTAVVQDDARPLGLPLWRRPGGRQLCERVRSGDHIVFPA